MDIFLFITSLILTVILAIYPLFINVNFKPWEKTIFRKIGKHGKIIIAIGILLIIVTICKYSRDKKFEKLKDDEQNRHISRSQNPLWPLGFHYSLEINTLKFTSLDESPILTELKKIDELIKSNQNDYSGRLGSIYGIQKLENNYQYRITDLYSGYENFKHFENIGLEIIVSPKSANVNSKIKGESENVQRALVIDVKANLKSKKNSRFGKVNDVDNFGIEILYNPFTKLILLNIFTNSLTKTYDDGQIKSTLDLKGNILNVYFASSLDIIKVNEISLMYGENYAMTQSITNYSFEKITNRPSFNILKKVLTNRYSKPTIIYKCSTNL